MDHHHIEAKIQTPNRQIIFKRIFKWFFFSLLKDIFQQSSHFENGIFTYVFCCCCCLLLAYLPGSYVTPFWCNNNRAKHNRIFYGSVGQTIDDEDHKVAHRGFHYFCKRSKKIVYFVTSYGYDRNRKCVHCAWLSITFQTPILIVSAKSQNRP